jgi:hypothetical protein
VLAVKDIDDVYNLAADTWAVSDTSAFTMRL